MKRSELIKRIQSWNLSHDDMAALAEVIPELAESEDERIRKALLRCCDDWEKGQYGCMNAADIPFIRAYLERQKEQKPAECIEDSVKFEEGFKAGRESGLRDGQKYVLNNLDSYGLCKPAEWSEEDERILKGIIGKIDHNQTYGVSKVEMLSFLKDLRPSWKPSEEQMKELELIINGKAVIRTDFIRTLYNDLKKLM